MNSKPGDPLNNGNNTDQQTDVGLIALIASANEQAFERLYHRFYSRLFRFIVRMMRRTDMVDEIINDVMYVVWEKAGTYNGQSLVSTWIFGIAHNKALQALRKNSQVQVESLEDLDVNSHYLTSHDAPASRLETENWLNSAFDQLSPDQRAVIELTYYQGLHYSEIALLMDCPENTVKTRMHHARKKLASALKEQ